MSLGIQSIGGLTGLGSTTGFYDPTMSSMMGMGGMNGMMGLGMMGMMSPQYIAQMGAAQQQMMELQQQMEKSQLNHAVDMHATTTDAEVLNLSAHDRALFRKAMTDGDVQAGISNLAEVIRKGDQDAICQEHDKLKTTIFTKYPEYISNIGSRGNVEQSVNNFIRLVYNNTLKKQNNGVPVDLYDDIKKYGESAFMHGVHKNLFFNRQDYHDKYTEETLSYITGQRIDNKRGKDKVEEVGGYASRYVLNPLMGAGAGATAGGVAGGVALGTLGKLANSVGIIKSGFWKNAWRGTKWGALAGMIAGTVYTVNRQAS